MLSNYKGKKVFVTGGAGFIGSHVVEMLVEKGADVTAFNQYVFKGDIGWLSNVKDKVKIYNGDIRDYHAIENAMRGSEIVLHLAASISIPYSIQHPKDVVDTNVTGTLNVLMAANANKVSRMVQISSSEVYGTAQYTPMDEKHPLNPQSPYAASKIAADKLCESFYRSRDTPVTIIRPFNTFGPRQSTRAFIPSTLIQMLDKNEINVGNLDTTRDFTYVTDTAHGMLLAGIQEEIEGETINLGTGREVKMKYVVDKLSEILGKDVRANVADERVRSNTAEIMRLQSDNSKAKKILGWKPEIEFEEGLKRTVEWFKKNRNDYRYLSVM